jgi:predicted amidohydrolase YtcJ
MARVGVMPGPQPMQVHLHADSLVEEYGEYGGRFDPYGSVERQGVPVVVSSNAPVTMPGPRCAPPVPRSHGPLPAATTPPRPRAPVTTLPFLGITRTPADLPDRGVTSVHAESGPDLGSCMVGIRADLVVLDTDPFTAPVDALATAAVTEILVGGERVRTQKGTS